MRIRSFTRHPAVAALAFLAIALAGRWWTLAQPLATPAPIDLLIQQAAPEIAKSISATQRPTLLRFTKAFLAQWQPWLIASQRVPRQQLADLLHQSADAIAPGEFNLELWRSGNQLTLQFAWPNALRPAAAPLPRQRQPNGAVLHWEQIAPLDEQQADALARAAEPLAYRYSPVRFPLAGLGTAPWSWSLLVNGQSIWQVSNASQRDTLIRWLQGVEPSWTGHDSSRSPDELASRWDSGNGLTVSWLGQSPGQSNISWRDLPDGNSIISTLSAVDIANAKIAKGNIGNQDASDTCQPITANSLQLNAKISFNADRYSAMTIANWQTSANGSIWTLCWSNR